MSFLQSFAGRYWWWELTISLQSMFHLILMFQDTSVFAFPTEAGNEIEGVIMLKAPINGITRHDIMVCVTMMSSTFQHYSFGSRNLTFFFITIILQLKNPYIGFAKFRAAFIGDTCNEWSVMPSEGFLKQNEATHFAVRFKPNTPGVSVGYFVIETEVR